MKSRIEIALFALLFLLGHSSLVRSQQPLSPEARKAYQKHQMEEAYKEKLHGSLDFNQGKNIQQNEGKGLPPSPTGSVDVPVSSDIPESEIHAAINPADSNNLVVAAMRVDNNGLNFPIYYTKNFGQTWEQSLFQPFPYDSNVLIAGGGDPVLTYDANGKLYLSWIDLYVPRSAQNKSYEGMYWASSTDGGETWQRAADGYIGKDSGSANTGPTTFDDKEWLTVDRTNSPYRNTLYAAWIHFGGPNDLNGIVVRRKLPGADSMEPAVQVSSSNLAGVQFTSLGIDAHGGVHVTYYGTIDGVTYSLYHAYSSDGGSTFQPEVKIADMDLPQSSADALQDSIFGIRTNGTYPCPHLSIDTAGTGDLYTVWGALGTTTNLHHGANIYFSRSTDNGLTWSDPSIVNNDRANTDQLHYTDHFYPSIAVNARGLVTVTWYDRREDTSNVVGRYYVAQSTDHGLTWTNYPVASRPMDFSAVGNQNFGFGIGEYTQVLMTPNYTIPFWADDRAEDGSVHIYTAFFPMNSSGIQTPTNGVIQANRISSISTGVELLDNYPNPFTSQTKLAFKVNARTNARLYVTNTLGQTVASILNGVATEGEHDFTFDASKFASGIYYCNLETDLGIVRRAMTIAR